MRLIFIVTLLIISTAARGGYSRVPSHSYPHSPGYSGTSHGTSYSGASGSHRYPSSHGLSGNTQYQPPNVRQSYHQPNGPQYNYNHKTEVHHHYHYSPPQQISYGSTFHPVYQGHPPVYVYEYRNSGSRFDSLLTGLALYNLGRSSTYHHHDSHTHYTGTPGEICKLGISKRNGEYEETRIDCKLMSSFIWEANSGTSQEHHVITNTVTTTTINNTQSANGIATVSVKTESTVQDALTVKGPSIEVTPDMTCFMIRISRDTSMLKRNVECALLQEYASRSLYRSSDGSQIKPAIFLFPVPFVLFLGFSQLNVIF